MKINVCMHEDDENIRLAIKTIEEKFGIDFSELYLLNFGADYNTLLNKPTINQITLEGALTAEDLGLGRVYYDTTLNWNVQTGLVSEKSAVYVYSDYQKIPDRKGNFVDVAGIKIGDGSTYLVDLPFVTDSTTNIIMSHINDTGIHVSSREKNFWNNKVSSYLDGTDIENLVLSKTNYTTQGDIYNG